MDLNTIFVGNIEIKKSLVGLSKRRQREILGLSSENLRFSNENYFLSLFFGKTSLGYAIKKLLGRYGKTNYYFVKGNKEEVRTKSYLGFMPITKLQNTKLKLEVKRYLFSHTLRTFFQVTNKSIKSFMEHFFSDVSVIGVDEMIPRLFYYVSRIFDSEYCTRMLFLFECSSDMEGKKLLDYLQAQLMS